MLLKQLKQLALSTTRRNADAVCLARFYVSPAVCQSLTTSKSSKRLSRDERRALVVSFVSEYKAANDGKFPTVKATLKEVGGGYYYVRDIIQELKHKPNAPLPIVAKALSEVSASEPNDTSSQILNHPPSHSSSCNANHFSPVVGDPVFQAGCPDTVETGSDQKQTTTDISHPLPDESNLEGNNSVISATHDERETETAPNIDIDSKCDSYTRLPEIQTSMASVECLKNSDTENEEKLTRLGSLESKADHLEGAAVSANVLPSETRQVLEKGATEVKTVGKPSAWSNIVSFAKEFASFWRKG